MEQDTPSGGMSLRYAIIGGAAGIAPIHIRALEQLPGAQIAGMSDINIERGAAAAQAAGCPFFGDHRMMLAELRPDVAVICAPHPFHMTLALDCFAAGAHVLVEKPIAVTVAEADRMIAAANEAGRLLAVNFQQRFRPLIERARALIEAGELGPLVRVLCVEPWFRTAAYYRSAGWRGTWRGEGGGVLLNQAPHLLDLLIHLAGMPVKVWGWTRTLRHAIECEDSAQAMLEFANGAPGYLSMSTVEAGKQRLQIVGERAALELAGQQLTITRFSPSLREHMLNSPQLFEAPKSTVEIESLPGDGGGHLAIYRDLEAAIAGGGRPRSDGLEGRQSLELANAIILSSFAERAVALPLDRAEYDALLDDLRQGDQEKGRQGDIRQ
ncbi:MAG TPA: Gfo/Idh/MocA family oxidoreductase [Roseiflexaceae bacterium]|nr:Gfo/Idh/MocA family oxidoreductase [Roseiflexaceae bacterium]